MTCFATSHQGAPNLIWHLHRSSDRIHSLYSLRSSTVKHERKERLNVDVIDGQKWFN